MADKREVFTILENATTAEGVAWPARAEGDTVAGNHAPVASVKDKDGNYALIPAQQSGETVAGNQIPVLGGKEQGGTFVNISQATEGETVAGDETPVLPCKNSSGNWAHIPLNSANQVPVSFASGTGKHATGKATPSALATNTTVATLSLTVDKTYANVKMSASSFFGCSWELVQLDDAAETVLAQGVSGPGDFSFEYTLDNIEITAGSTGTQSLFIRGQQKNGALTDMRGIISANELL